MSPRRRANPTLMLLNGAERFSRRVRRVEYEHDDDSPGEIRQHDFEAGVEMMALPTGDILLRHSRGKRLWDNFPDGS